jgi:UDP-N-acetylmuramate-alanine ligase
MWFKRIKKSNIWNLTDDVIKIKDIVNNQTPEFSSRFKLTRSLTCMRDMKNTNIYILKEDVEKFKQIKMVYDINSDFVNISILKNNYAIKYDVYSVVANKAVPQAVNIKFVWYCNIMNVNLFIETVYILPQSTNLFKDLLNFENLKRRYELK